MDNLASQKDFYGFNVLIAFYCRRFLASIRISAIDPATAMSEKYAHYAR
jgi:hypothetical protein